MDVVPSGPWFAEVFMCAAAVGLAVLVLVCLCLDYLVRSHFAATHAAEKVANDADNER
jgi:hypothetical protein